MNLARFFPDNAFPSVSRGDDFPWDLGLRRETSEARWIPRADVYETESTIYVEMDVPGVMKDHVDVTVEGGRLIISGSRDSAELGYDEDTAEKATLHRQERPSGHFQREYNLPESVDQNNINAQLDNGVLKIELAKSESSIPKKVDVQIN